MTTTENSRADALTVPTISRDAFYAIVRKAVQWYRSDNPSRYLNDDQVDADDAEFVSNLADQHAKILTASPVEQPAAAPIEARWIAFADALPPLQDNGRGDTARRKVLVTNNINARDAFGDPSHVWLGNPNLDESHGWYVYGGGRFLTHWADPFVACDPAPSPADERAAFSAWVKTQDSGVSLFDAYLYGKARAASATETGTEGAAIPEPDDDILCVCGWENWRPEGYVDRGTAERRYQLVAGYILSKLAAPQPHAMAAEAVAGLFVKRSKFGPWIEIEKPEPGAVTLYTAPQPAQADAREAETAGQQEGHEIAQSLVRKGTVAGGDFAREGLTDDQRSVIASLLESDVLSVDEDAVLREILAAHPGQPEPRTTAQPPIDNDHVADGCEKFGSE